eukprot:gene16734-20096_t
MSCLRQIIGRQPLRTIDSTLSPASIERPRLTKTLNTP